MMKRTIYKYQMLLMALVLGLSSCEDWLNIHPQSETILEDYWKDENDVKSAVAACYRAMNEAGFMDRLLVWGEVRSDNVVEGRDVGQSHDLERILNLTLNATNGYTSWYEFYRVINYCNTVIYYAPTVREKDPNFTDGQLAAYLTEAKGIRALCYFTLVRTFRDIPFSTEPVFDDSRSFELPQSDPEDIINFLIDDLKSIENASIAEFDNVRYDKGRITRKAIWTLIADMALWINDYKTAIDYCDKVVASAGSKLTLESSANYNRNLFFTSDGSSSETIFDLLFTGNFSNTPVNSMYEIKLSAYGFMTNTNLFGSTDLRAKDAFCPIESTGGYFSIMKYVGYRNIRPNTTAISINDYSYNTCWNWIFYRLADVYLIKAEALVERNTGTDLQDAFALVSAIYDRANPELGKNALNNASYTTRETMRDLVFDERQREFLFEGKRYFDLLRRIKRDGNTTAVVNQYLIRKYSNIDQATVRSKINDKDALYMPVNENELKVNKLLRQNPFYIVSSDINKN
jgi:hypothetical protein